MDHVVSSVERHISDQEEDNWFACFECAYEAGKTQEDAENCDDGDCNCPNCPWNS